MDTEVLGQLLGSAVLAAVLGALVNGWINRKKLGADATEIITKAASGVVSNVQADNTRLRTEVEELRETVETFRDAEQGHHAERDRWRAERDQIYAYVRDHRAYDLKTAQLIRDRIDPSFPDPDPFPLASRGRS